MLEGPALSGPRSRRSATLHQEPHFHESIPHHEGGKRNFVTVQGWSWHDNHLYRLPLKGFPRMINSVFECILEVPYGIRGDCMFPAYRASIVMITGFFFIFLVNIQQQNTPFSLAFYGLKTHLKINKKPRKSQKKNPDRDKTCRGYFFEKRMNYC